MTGELIYVIGPSGSGKDSVMADARDRLAGSGALFAHRYITRPASAGGENHVHLSEAEFQARLDNGLFALHWDSHGWRYGIGSEIGLWLSRGLPVVVNGSRAYLGEAVGRYPKLLPVLVEVDPDILRQRLLARGRETPVEIERRLARGERYPVSHPRLERVDNSGDLADAGERLAAIVSRNLHSMKKAV
ncbi:phosphonate metabolism protein/1,5-bisphosphokinase (PRPP-forming) PhnN [Pseudodesulfovibrio cashew]|uniref:Ribose 1,5-bisphosphate phosphokinase PhnN n=1 Tax=Pseudodesulfovibrio cashew TaxID=2678688 RepID=A0A6I6JDV3_9BACT|nr:phosphonate metabolism protein/1,5-bisphosphokinase (PRPP-forming) PhnN [Pseudodesulfovibrio cashew]QGY39198.1 phosphonate metabolism protein/1,5-bisphosphokinase (PRPP-forming) PhnN [Pseudodesulfovibrio cashew]